MISQPAEPNNVVVSNLRISTQCLRRRLLGERLQLRGVFDCRQQQWIGVGVEPDARAKAGP